MQETHYQIKGMSQDLAYQLFNPQYAFECKNIRINTTDENSLLSLNSEQGNKLVGTLVDSNIEKFKVLGVGQFSDYCIVFGTTEDSEEPDYILKLSNGEISILLNGSFNFNKDHDIKTVCVYENEKIQKVYWIDGINPPRVLNVADSEEVKNLDEQKLDFLPKLQFNEKVTITKASGGLFPSGVIQYAFTYSDKKLQESNIWYVSPLYYITESTKGAEAGKICNTAFKLQFDNIDKSFDYIQIYAILRTSINAIPQCYKIANVDTTTETFIDSGNHWESCSIEDILGKQLGSFVPQVMTTKDSTLFLGNYTINSPFIESNDTITTIGNNLDFTYRDLNLEYNDLKPEERSVKTFRSGEWYRFGIQFQDEYGTPSNVVYLKDIEAPISNGEFFTQKLIKAILPEELPTSITSKFKRARLLMVDRTNLPHKTLCQGVLCPTVYTPIERVNNAPFAMSSWCMRGYTKNEDKSTDDNSRPIRWKGNRALWSYLKKEGGELANQIDSSSYAGTNYDNKKFPGENKLIIVDTENKSEYTEKSYFYVAVCYTYMPSSATSYITQHYYLYLRLVKSSTEGLTYNEVISLPESNEIYEIPKNTTIFTVLNNITSADDPTSAKYLYLNTLLPYLWEQLILPSIINTGTPHPEIVAQSLLDQLLNWGAFAPYSNSLLEYSDAVGQFQVRGLNSEWDSVPIDFDSALAQVKDNINPFYCDHNIITFHSPDVVKYSTIIDNNPNIKYRAIGYTYIESNYLDYYIIASDPKNSGKVGIQAVDRRSKGGLGNASLWKDAYLYPIYIWHRDNTLGSSTEYGLWDKKIMSNVHKCGNSHAFKKLPVVGDILGTALFPKMGTPRVFNQEELGGLQLDNQPYSTNRHRKLIYFGNVKTLHSIGGAVKYSITQDAGTNGIEPLSTSTAAPCSIQYKSTPHVVMPMSYLRINNSTEVCAVTLPWINDDIPYIPSNKMGYIWATSIHGFVHPLLNIATYGYSSLNPDLPVLYIAELYQDLDVKSIYGEATDNNITKHTWIPISDWVSLEPNKELIGYGDTFVGRWECLKTYPFNAEDSQSYLDITSFIVESDTNLSARCDSYKDTTSAATLDASKFNIFNPVYDQQNNIFSYSAFSAFESIDNFQNQICWSGVKTLGEDLDTWCQINVGNNTDLQGEYGQLRSIINFNNNLYCFQDDAIYKLNYNTRVAITPSDGGPIQLSNNYNVDPPLLLNSNYGVSSFKHVSKGTAALYFLDSKRKRILNIDNKESINELSTAKGVNSLISKLGVPTQITVDPNIKDVYFNFSDIALGFNEDLMEFTSLYSYNKADAIVALSGSTYAFCGNNIYKQRSGAFGYFFGNPEPYYIELLANENPIISKTFTNVEFYSDSNNDLIFDTITTNTSYQSGEMNLELRKIKPSNLKRKFRLWRADLPRDKDYCLDRMRDNWCKVKLTKSAIEDMNKFKINHISISYILD